ncbi:MAG: hypothetical protein KF832_23605 [Caldilineaceae bacterium]|nr:hypothetical protein [Caldilineaceae bacterium]
MPNSPTPPTSTSAKRSKRLRWLLTVPGKQLWLMRSDGREAKALTSEAAFDFGPPLWSPDGRYLLFHKLPLQGPDITLSVWILEATSGRTWQVASPGQRPQWVP